MPQTEQMPCRVVRFTRPVGGKEGFEGITVLARNYYESPADSILNVVVESDRKYVSNFLRDDGPIYAQKFAPTAEFPRGGKILRVFNNEYIYTLIEDAEYEARELDKLLFRRRPNYGRFNGATK